MTIQTTYDALYAGMKVEDLQIASLHNDIADSKWCFLDNRRELNIHSNGWLIKTSVVKCSI